MGILQTPNKMQPLDVAYVGQIVDQVNANTTAIGDRSTSYSNINGTSVKTGDIKFFATTVSVVASTNKTDGDVVDVTVSYPPFRGYPVVTGTLVSGSSSNIGDNSSVVLKTVSSQQATFRVTFNRGGTLQANLNVIAVGFSETS